MCGEVEHDADVLLSLAALIKATALGIVFEGILLKDTPIKVRVLRASEEREKGVEHLRPAAPPST